MLQIKAQMSVTKRKLVVDINKKIQLLVLAFPTIDVPDRGQLL